MFGLDVELVIMTNSTMKETWIFPVLKSLQVGLRQGATGGTERSGGKETVRQQWHREESQKPTTVRFCECYDEGKPQARLGKGRRSSGSSGCEPAVQSTVVLACRSYTWS